MLEKYVSLISLKQLTLTFNTSVKNGTAVTLFSPPDTRTTEHVTVSTGQRGITNLIVHFCHVVSYRSCSVLLSLVFTYLAVIHCEYLLSNVIRIINFFYITFHFSQSVPDFRV
jgi:hypothetical protein